MVRTETANFESGNARPTRPHDQSYAHLIASFFGVIAACVVWIYFLPGFVAWIEGVFTTEQVESIVKGRGYPGAEKEFRDHRQHLAFERIIDARIEAAIAAEDVSNLEKLTKMKEAEEARWERRKPEAVFVAFEHNVGNILWLMTYVALGLNLRVINPAKTNKMEWRNATIRGIGLFLLFGWPNWLRHLQSMTDDRVVFSWAQPDVSWMSSLMQEFRFLVWCILICRSWAVWLEIARGEMAAVPASGDRFELVEYLESMEHANARFHRWQVDSFVVGVIFLPITYHFWRIVVKAGDVRYLDSAVVFQLLWGLTWLITTLPLVHSLARCSAQRMALTVQAMDSKRPIADEVLRRMMEMKPLDQSKVLASLTAALLSFVLPLLQIIF